ncbi:MAG: hypothetical protein KJZ96_01305 [Rhodocyclaceae bacterium]|nr:hypothetical protein [Rhodocyclaceae bacterium]MCL4756958.1 hypothetical protein [Rhodocyclaceae bacterium]
MIIARFAPVSPVTRERLRLLSIFIACLTVAASVLLVYAALQGASIAAERLQAQAEELAGSIAVLSRSEVASNDRIALARRLESFNEFSGIRTMVITDRLGEPLAAVRRNAAGNLSAAPGREVSFSWSPGGIAPRRSRVDPDQSVRTVWTAIGQIAPIGWIYLEYDGHLINAARDHILSRGLLWLIPVLIVSAAIFAWAIRVATGAGRRETALARLADPSRPEEEIT